MMRIVLALIGALMLAPAARAQDAAATFPNRPIHIIVSVPAGGGVDTVTRIIAQHLQEKLGQPVVVENRAGAGGNLGAEFVFTSPPDGYTLLASQPSPITVNPMLYKKIAFDPTKFEPVAIMTTIGAKSVNSALRRSGSTPMPEPGSWSPHAAAIRASRAGITTSKPTRARRCRSAASAPK
jgi:tripartite-type tricarboxylate transporter receptor subunit TctC